jgi:hypothetical protein
MISAGWRISGSSGRVVQHQPADPAGGLHGEMLGEPAAPGDPEDVGALIAELVEQAGDERRQRGHVVRDYRGGRAADAGHVEPDDLPLGFERADERLEHFQAGADAVAQQQRRPLRVPPSHSDPQVPAADREGAHGGAPARALGQDAQGARPAAVVSLGLEVRISGHRRMIPGPAARPAPAAPVSG